MRRARSCIPGPKTKFVKPLLSPSFKLVTTNAATKRRYRLGGTTQSGARESRFLGAGNAPVTQPRLHVPPAGDTPFIRRHRPSMSPCVRQPASRAANFRYVSPKRCENQFAPSVPKGRNAASCTDPSGLLTGLGSIPRAAATLAELAWPCPGPLFLAPSGPPKAPTSQSYRVAAKLD